MITEIAFIETNQTDPYQNLAVEEYLLLNCREQQCILYLWQNQHTVVIGRNQNAWKECQVGRLTQSGGHLARRLSGGGAVYHDLGNLNFTFLVRKDNYNVDQQLQVILKAIRKLGIWAVKSGRNDLVVAGRKFSGNAFYDQGLYCYHHGTIMFDVDVSELSKYLTVSKEKLKSKGVDSVKSRVINLKELVPDLTLEQLREAFAAAFQEVYGLVADVISIADLDQAEIEGRREKFRSEAWLFGRKIPFEYEISKRFDWGSLTCQFHVMAGQLAETGVYSDALRPEMILALPDYLKGIAFDQRKICESLSKYRPEDAVEQEMMKDIIDWFETVDL